MIKSGRAPLKASEQLARRLRVEMASGALPVGTMLPPEAKMMAELGVGRPTLREALRLLEAESLVRVRRGAHGGVEVTAPTTDAAAQTLSMVLAYVGAPLREVLEVRSSLETEAFAAALTPRSVRRLAVSLADAAEATLLIDPSDAVAVLDADDGFRAVGVAEAKVPTYVVLSRLLREMTIGQRRAQVAALSAGAARRFSASVLAAHEAIAASVAADDRQEALDAWAEHCADIRVVVGTPRNRRTDLMATVV